MKRDDRFNVRLTADEREMLAELASERNESAAVVLRELVRREYRKTFGATATPKARTR